MKLPVIVFDGLDGHDLALLSLCATVAALALLGIALSALGEWWSARQPRPAAPRGATRIKSVAVDNP